MCGFIMVMSHRTTDMHQRRGVAYLGTKSSLELAKAHIQGIKEEGEEYMRSRGRGTRYQDTGWREDLHGCHRRTLGDDVFVIIPIKVDEERTVMIELTP